MTTFNRTDFFSANTTLEAHLVHAIMAYRATVGGARFSERSETDRQPFCFYQAGEVFTEAYDSRRFFIARVGIILDPDGAATANPLYAQTQEFPQALLLPGIYKDPA